jgi:hypothetical protein
MAFLPPVIFTPGTAVTAADLNANKNALKLYADKVIAPGDLASEVFSTADIVRGEYAVVVPDHQFTTGDFYTQNKLADDNGGQKQYYSSTIKTVLGDDSPPGGQWGLIDQYQIVCDTGKSIYFESNNKLDQGSNLAAKIVITGHISADNSLQYVYNSSYFSGSSQETRFYLFYRIDGLVDYWQKILDTKGQIIGFEDYQNYAVLIGSSDRGTNTNLDKRVIPFLYEIDIPNLWATSFGTPYPKTQDLAWRFAIGVETTVDLGFINNRFMTYEVFYC